MTRTKKYALLILSAVAIAGIAAAFWVYAVYNGYLLLNNPSRRQYPVRGVDVSHYQGEIDWEVLSGEDIRFAYIKATEGSSHRDDKFAVNWEAVKGTGLNAGAYHFFSFDSPGESQAQNFINTVGMAEDVHQELKIMLDGLQKHYRVQPVIYSTEEVWESYLKGYFDEYPLWIRNVFRKTAVPESKWTFWQYSNRGRLNGYSGAEEYVDLNVFYGNEAEWEEFCRSAGESAGGGGEQQ